MKQWVSRLGYIISTSMFALLAVLFVGVLYLSLCNNPLEYGRDVFNPLTKGNYFGLLAGVLAYLIYLPFICIPHVRHNHNLFAHFTHELTHALFAVAFLTKIREFVVRENECFVCYTPPRVGYVPITLSPYCVPVYTLQILPFRYLAGDSPFMLVFDFMIAFTYAFHVHCFIKQTRFTQSDLEGCGYARSVAFISFVHLTFLSLLVAIPRGGLANSLGRVFIEYPEQVFDYLARLFLSL